MKLNVIFRQEESRFKVGFKQSETMKVGFGQIQTITVDNDYNKLTNKPSINGVTLQGDLTSDDLGIAASFPEEGLVGDILMKISSAKDGVAWVTPASSSEEDNTRPITAAAVYTEIGNINALLAII